MAELQYGFLLTSLIAGFLTVLSPCVLPVLPIVISGSLEKRSFLKPLRIIAALIVSIIVFSILLKASTILLGVPSFVWRWLSGGILVIFGLFILCPDLWTRLIEKLNLNQASQKLLNRGIRREGAAGDFIVGAALGPVFTSCSPAYAYIVAISLPTNWVVGFVYLLVFSLGLAAVLIMIALLGQKFIGKLKALSNPKGWFKKIIALIFIVVGLLVITGYDKRVEAYLVERGFYDWLINIEDSLPTPES